VTNYLHLQIIQLRLLQDGNVCWATLNRQTRTTVTGLFIDFARSTSQEALPEAVQVASIYSLIHQQHKAYIAGVENIVTDTLWRPPGHEVTPKRPGKPAHEPTAFKASSGSAVAEAAIASLPLAIVLLFGTLDYRRMAANPKMCQDTLYVATYIFWLCRRWNFTATHSFATCHVASYNLWFQSWTVGRSSRQFTAWHIVVFVRHIGC
jgi:hypothetical protein